MKTLRYLVMAGVLLLGTSSLAQKFPEFQRNFVADTKIPLVTAKGPILWESRAYEVHNSPTRTIYELRGYIKLPIKAIGFIRPYTLHLGAITRIDSTTIESIIYTRNRPDETLSEYDMDIAKREGIDTKGVESLWHEKYDYTNNTITNLETGEVQAMNGANEFQGLYFKIPKDKDLDTLVTVRFCGENLPINIKVNDGIICADLTISDTKNPTKRKKLLPPILSMSVHTDKYGLPDKMVAGAEIGKKFYPEATYAPENGWTDLRYNKE